MQVPKTSETDKVMMMAMRMAMREDLAQLSFCAAVVDVEYWRCGRCRRLGVGGTPITEYQRKKEQW
jgi:hypothetical protein